MTFDINLRPEMKVYKGQSFNFIQPKLDGHRVTVISDRLGLRVLARTADSDYGPKLMRSATWTKKLKCLPNDTAFDAELYVPGGQATSVPNKLNEAPDELEIGVFAVPWWSGVDSRCQHMTFALERAISCGFEVTSTMHRDQDQSVDKMIELATPWLQNTKPHLAHKLEGWVIKEAHYSGWYKLKAKRTMDVVVMEWKEGKGRNVGLMGSVVVGVWRDGELVKVGTVGGWSDEERQLLAEDVEGQVLECEYDSLTQHDQLKFARVVRWRDDKPSHQCLWSQVEEAR